MENETSKLHKKLYSKNTILIGTFFGGLLAAGYMMRENFIALGKPQKAQKALLLGIIGTIIIIGGIVMIPETIIDKVPHILIPTIYTAIIFVLIEKYQGADLKKHQENKSHLFSVWRAVAIGIISSLIMVAGFFITFYLITSKEYRIYDNEMESFYNNETKSLLFYDNLGVKNDRQLIRDLKSIAIPAWEENIEIIKKTNEIENLPSELVLQNEILLEYSELRLKAFELFYKAFTENTSQYDDDLEKTHDKIEEVLNKL